MDDIAELFARTDPALTPSSTPVPQEAQALLAEIVATGGGHARSRRAAPGRFPRWSGPVAMIMAGAVALLIGVVVLTVGGPREVSSAPEGDPLMADYPWYATEESLTAAADAIITADVVDRYEQRVDAVPYTIITVRIVAVAKGQLDPGDSLELWYPAATQPEPIGLDLGERVLLLLAVYPGAPASLVNPVQGSYLVHDNNGIEPGPQNPVQLSARLLTSLGLKG